MVQKSKKPMGRPRAFDMDTALHHAMKVFWKKGFDGTSLDDLQEAMGIGRPSLYHAFGDKRGLFLQTLKHYSQTVANTSVEQLHRFVDVREALAAFLGRAVTNVHEDSLGCLIGCVASSVNDAEVREFMRVSAESVQTAVGQVLREAVESGQLPPDFPVEERARRAFDLLIALGFRGRSGAGLQELTEDAARSAALLVAPGM